MSRRKSGPFQLKGAFLSLTKDLANLFHGRRSAEFVPVNHKNPPIIWQIIIYCRISSVVC